MSVYASTAALPKSTRGLGIRHVLAMRSRIIVAAPSMITEARLRSTTWTRKTNRGERHLEKLRQLAALLRLTHFSSAGRPSLVAPQSDSNSLLLAALECRTPESKPIRQAQLLCSFLPSVSSEEIECALRRLDTNRQVRPGRCLSPP
jgi:hypothetical protein